MKVASASVALIVVGSPCEASYFTRQAASGKPTTAYVYRNWDKDCRERGGVVKVVTKPQHGRLTKERIVAPMVHQGRSSDTHCNGVTIPGPRVVYTSFPGYRGLDQFVVERTLPNGRVDVDTYTINVQ